MRVLSAALVTACLLAQAPPRSRWKIKFFHDQDNTSMAFGDLKFVSPKLGMAVGVLVNTSSDRGRPAPVSLITRDGGNSWTQQKMPETARALFALHEAAVWMVAENDGLYRTSDFGQTWKRLATLKGALRVHFVSEKLGYAVGARKSVWRTNDGGQKWVPLPEAAKPTTKEENTVYTDIAFIDAKRGLIAGYSRPPQRRAGRVPEWMDPDSQPAQRPVVAIMLDTDDGGVTWRAQTASVFGHLSRVVSTPKFGLSLIEFGEGFPWPSEVLKVYWNGLGNKRTFREKDRAVRDVGIDSIGRGYLVAVERSGSISALPIPGKLHVLESLDLEKWTEADVDYKAVANHAVMAIASDDSRFIATDTGMILKYE